MGKAAKSKREEAASEKEEAYEFKLPHFDEKTFIRRELATAKASFYVLGIGIVAGIVSAALHLAPMTWAVGWLPIFASLLLLRPALTRFGFGEEVTAWKSIFGSMFIVFFTGLSVWILGVNMLT